MLKYGLAISGANKLQVKAVSGESALELLNDSELAAAVWVFDNKQIAGRGTDTFMGVQGFYAPLSTE